MKTSRLPRVYVAGPFGGDQWNVIDHFQVMRKLFKCPDISLYSWSWMAKNNDNTDVEHVTEADAIEANMRELEQCDAIFIGASGALNDSKGVQQAVTRAIALGLPVFTSTEALFELAKQWRGRGDEHLGDIESRKEFVINQKKNCSFGFYYYVGVDISSGLALSTDQSADYVREQCLSMGYTEKVG